VQLGSGPIERLFARQNCANQPNGLLLNLEKSGHYDIVFSIEGEELMTVSAAITESPNLFDLLEAHQASNAKIDGPFSFGNAVCSDEVSDGNGPATTSHSVCADEGPVRSAGPAQTGSSVCSDDEPIPGLTRDEPAYFAAGFSLCADDGEDTPQPSDVRLKTDIEQVGTTVYGLPLYHFRYKSGEERFEGVMAQDVLDLMPEAVSVGSDGFYRVNYRKLGIAMTPVLPNLLDLIESSPSEPAYAWGQDLSIASDDPTIAGSPCAVEQGAGVALELPQGFADCSDDRTRQPDISHAMRVDEVTGGRPEAQLSSFAICADDGSDTILPPPPNGFSVCADDSSAESDVRLKADMEQVGTTVYGLPLYHFRYKTGEERFEGVMAQDVLEVMPDAVSIGSNGFFRVDYAKLGIAMTRV